MMGTTAVYGLQGVNSFDERSHEMKSEEVIDLDLDEGQDQDFRVRKLAIFQEFVICGMRL